jgi:hypothetical protein
VRGTFEGCESHGGAMSVGVQIGQCLVR